MIDVHIPPVYQYPDNFCKQHPDSVAEDEQDMDTLAQRRQARHRAGLFSSGAIRNLLTRLTESCLMASLTHAEQRKKSAAL